LRRTDRTSSQAQYIGNGQGKLAINSSRFLVRNTLSTALQMWVAWKKYSFYRMICKGEERMILL
ncbi:hypothetical protein ACQP3L_40070, partial [Escherichia coli]